MTCILYQKLKFFEVQRNLCNPYHIWTEDLFGLGGCSVNTESKRIYSDMKGFQKMSGFPGFPFF